MQGYDLIHFIEYLVNNLNEFLTRCTWKIVGQMWAQIYHNIGKIGKNGHKVQFVNSTTKVGKNGGELAENGTTSSFQSTITMEINKVLATFTDRPP